MGPIWRNSIAAIHLLLGDADAYLSHLDRALEAHPMQVLGGMYNPVVAKTWADPRYASLVRRTRLQLGFDIPGSVVRFVKVPLIAGAPLRAN